MELKQRFNSSKHIDAHPCEAPRSHASFRTTQKGHPSSFVDSYQNTIR